MSEYTEDYEAKANALAERYQKMVENGTFYGVYCIEGEPMFLLLGDYAVRPGHVYSKAGVDEVSISGVCEYHFDNLFPEDDEEDEGDSDGE